MCQIPPVNSVNSPRAPALPRIHPHPPQHHHLPQRYTSSTHVSSQAVMYTHGNVGHCLLGGLKVCETFVAFHVKLKKLWLVDI